jgi:hypothetical protein
MKKTFAIGIGGTAGQGLATLGDRVDLLIPLNQDAMDRYLREWVPRQEAKMARY